MCSIHIEHRSHHLNFFYKIIKYISIYLYILRKLYNNVCKKKKASEALMSNAMQTKGYTLLSWYQILAAKDRHK